MLELPLRGSAWGLVASADFKSVGPVSVGSVGGFDSLALPPAFSAGGCVISFFLEEVIDVER